MKLERILITGGPKTGKTSLATKLHVLTGWPLMWTDSTMGHGHDWSERIKLVATEWLTQPGPWIIEGVMVPHAVRALTAPMLFHPEQHSTFTPADLMIFLTEPKLQLSKGQLAMTEGVKTVYQEIRGKIREPQYPLAYCAHCKALTDQSHCLTCTDNPLTQFDY